MNTSHLITECGRIWTYDRRLFPSMLQAVRDSAPMAAAKSAASKGRTEGRVGVVPIRGVITPRASWVTDLFGGTPLNWLADAIETMINAPNVSAVVLDVDSPGGSLSLVQETAKLIRDLRDKKPIIAVANTLMASAAYWIASAADEIIASPSAEIGSIGVYAIHEDWSEANKKLGVETSYIVSTGSPRKVDGNPDEPLSREARADLQADVDAVYSKFTSDLMRYRGLPYSAVREAADGRTFGAAKAKALGLVDRVATLREVLRDTARGGAESRIRSKRLKRKYAFSFRDN